jgi:hypothetical protein
LFAVFPQYYGSEIDMAGNKEKEVTLLFVKISRQVGMEMQYNALQEGQD